MSNPYYTYPICLKCGNMPCMCAYSIPMTSAATAWPANYANFPLLIKGRVIRISGSYIGPDLTGLSEAYCSKCKTIYSIYSIDKIALSYGYIKSSFYICNKCYFQQLSRQYSIEANFDLEETLF